MLDVHVTKSKDILLKGTYMRCRHHKNDYDLKHIEIKMKELSGGVIYRAIICTICNREIGHTTFDPVTQTPRL